METILFKPLICQECKRKLGEIKGLNYQIVMKCRRCKTFNTFNS